MFTQAPDTIPVMSSLLNFVQHISTYPTTPFAVDFAFEKKDIGSHIDQIEASLVAGDCNHMRLLDLSSSNVKPKMVEQLAAVLPLCPPGFALLLSGNHIGERGIQALITVLRSGLCPEGLTLHLGDGNYDYQAVLKLIEVIPFAPKGFTLEVNVDIYHNETASDNSRQTILNGFAALLQTGLCPPQLTIRLSGLRLELPVLLDPLANALLHPACPRDLTLILNADFIDIPNSQRLLSALRHASLPPAFRLYFVKNDDYFPLPPRTQWECTISLIHAKTILVDKVSQHLALMNGFMRNTRFFPDVAPAATSVPTTIIPSLRKRH